MDDLSGKTVLIVEDERPLVEALKMRLEQDKAKVLTARNGKEGLHRALANHPDLIVLDIVMPVLDGKRMAEEIRRNEWGKNVPMLVLTNLSSEYEDMMEIVDNYKAIYMLKAKTKLDEVVEKVKELLNNE